MGLGEQLGDHGVLVVVPISGCYNVFLVWQFFPTKLFFDGVGRIHHPPFINRTRWADRNTVHAHVADVCVDHHVVIVVYDCLNRAAHFTGVTPDTNLWVNKVLFKRLVHMRSFGGALGPALVLDLDGEALRHVQFDVLKITRFVVDPDLWWCDPRGVFARLIARLHQGLDEGTIFFCW